MQFSWRVRNNLYKESGFFAYLYFSVYSLFPFHLFQLPWSLASDFFKSETCRVYYLSFSTLYHITTDVCLQEKAKTWKTHYVSVPSWKCGLASKIYLLFLRHHVVLFCIFPVFIYLLEGYSVESLLHDTRNWNLGVILKLSFVENLAFSHVNYVTNNNKTNLII